MRNARTRPLHFLHDPAHSIRCSQHLSVNPFQLLAVGSLTLALKGARSRGVRLECQGNGHQRELGDHQRSMMRLVIISDAPSAAARRRASAWGTIPTYMPSMALR